MAVSAKHKQKVRGVGIAWWAERIETDLRSIRRALRRPLESEAAQSGLTVPQTAVMRIVMRQKGINLKDLSHEVGLAHSTVSGIVDRLEKQELIERRTDPHDARNTHIYPTLPVTEFVRKRIPQLARGPLVVALKRVTEAERREIGNAVQKLRELVEKT
jgi:DNA-binding MarR family transcriptional regulator